MDSFYANILEDLKNINTVVFDERSQMANEQTLELSKNDVVKVMQLLHEKHGFNFMMDLCGVVWPEREKRFDVVYHLLTDKGFFYLNDKKIDDYNSLVENVYFTKNK